MTSFDYLVRLARTKGTTPEALADFTGCDLEEARQAIRAVEGRRRYPEGGFVDYETLRARVAAENARRENGTSAA